MALRFDQTDGKARLVDNRTGAPAVHATAASWRFTARAFRVRFDVQAPCVTPRGTRFNDPLYLGDIAEVMVSLGAPDRYLELEVNPNGVGYSVVVDSANGERVLTPVAFPFSPAAHLTPRGWRAAFTLPYCALRALGWTGEEFRFNLYRQQFLPDGTLCLYALSPTHSDTFHHPASFARVTPFHLP